MKQVRITLVSGATYPIEVFITDVYGNNRYLLGTISSGPVPPTVTYNTVIPSIFNTAPQVKLLIIDSEGCETSKILECTFNCLFEIIISLLP
jgi:hypothetical protein